MDWQPSPKYRYAFKRGMSGADVWALQLNLQAGGFTLSVDGDFGPATEQAVKAFQSAHKLDVDGIAGLVTQRELCLMVSQPPSDQYKLPDGLLKGIMANESGFAVAAYSPHPSDPGFDLGPYQDSFPPRAQSQGNYANAYNAKALAAETAKKVRAQKDIYRKAPKVSTDRYAWELALLYHNWPVASENLAYVGSIFKNAVLDTQPATWIVVASAGTLSTPRQWVEHYIQKSTVFITDWPA